MKIYLPLAILSISIFVQPSFADTSTNYTTKARMAWSALECTVLASFAEKKQPEQKGFFDQGKRLFALGYKAAKEVITAAKEKKLNDENFDGGEIPLFFKFFIQIYPSIDFSIGRMYEFIVGITDDEIKKRIIDKKLMADEQLRGSIASNIFWEKNCSLIGSDHSNIK